MSVLLNLAFLLSTFSQDILNFLSYYVIVCKWTVNKGKISMGEQ